MAGAGAGAPGAAGAAASGGASGSDPSAASLGGAAPSNGPTGVGGASAASGSAGTAGVAVSPDGRPVCAHYPARADGLLVDFDTYDVIGGSWGDPSQGHLTGGTSTYSCADDGVTCPNTAIIARVRTGGGGLRIQAAVPSRGHTGMVLWFGPCVDASAFGGIELQAGGELFGAVLSIKLQTHDNYPIDRVNLKGGCEFSSEATKWSECVPPAFDLASVTSEPSTVQLGWSDFTSGLPNAGVTPEGLVGIDLQFECPEDVDCAMDLSLSALRLSPAL